MLLLAPRLFLRAFTPDTRELGEAGEWLAARALRRAGWSLVGRRVRTPFGEVDLVTEREGELWCWEVKSGRFDPSRALWRPADRQRPATRAKQLRAAAWLAARRGKPRCGLALVEVLVAESGDARLLFTGETPSSQP